MRLYGKNWLKLSLNDLKYDLKYCVGRMLKLQRKHLLCTQQRQKKEVGHRILEEHVKSGQRQYMKKHWQKKVMLKNCRRFDMVKTKLCKERCDICTNYLISIHWKKLWSNKLKSQSFELSREQIKRENREQKWIVRNQIHVRNRKMLSIMQQWSRMSNLYMKLAGKFLIKILCLHQRKKENQYNSAKACYGYEWHHPMITLYAEPWTNVSQLDFLCSRIWISLFKNLIP